MADDPYAGLAGRYDLFFGGFGEHDAAVAAFYRRLFTENGVHTVLDCACGTDQDLHLFYTLGCEAYGSDISDAMLARAHQNLAGRGIQLPLQKADYGMIRNDYWLLPAFAASISMARMPSSRTIRRGAAA